MSIVVIDLIRRLAAVHAAIQKLRLASWSQSRDRRPSQRIRTYLNKMRFINPCLTYLLIYLLIWTYLWTCTVESDLRSANTALSAV